MFCLSLRGRWKLGSLPGSALLRGSTSFRISAIGTGERRLKMAELNSGRKKDE